MDDFFNVLIPSTGISFQNVSTSISCFLTSVHSYSATQACSQMLPPPPLLHTADPITANLRAVSTYRRLDFLLSAAALHSKNRLLLYVNPYRCSEWSPRQTAGSSVELTGSLGCDYMQLAPPATLSSSSAVTSRSRFLPDLL